MAEARIDKWLWASRIFKTRTIAAEACKKGRISINGAQTKPARMIKAGDVIQVKKPPIIYSFKVLQPIEKRVGAKLVNDILENVTTPDQYELMEMNKISGLLTELVALDVLPKKIDETWTISLLLNSIQMMISTSTLILIMSNEKAPYFMVLFCFCI